MKELKYIKLFEAFESEKLSKTLGYVDKKSREQVLQRLREICSGIDFPFSQLNDSYFQYLPYQKALNLQYVGQKNPCKATSSSVFDRQYAIEGEKCEGGRIKRIWGSRQRVVECPHCGGTGIEPEKQEVKLIKFWFTKEGEMVTITGVDNRYKPEIKSKLKSFSREISNYVAIGDTITRRGDTSFLQNGDFVIAKLQSGSDEIICYVLKEGRRLFLIQDYHDGDTPSSDYKSIANYSWNISDGDFITLRKVEPKTIDKTEEDENEIDPFSFNRLISFGYRGTLSFDRHQRGIDKLVGKAHFALVFNIDSLKNTEFKTKREIGEERAEVKSGSRLTVKDSDIKKANIERYMKEIALRSDIVSDISNLPKVVKRIIGGENVFFLMIYNSRFFDSLNRLAEYYIEALKEGKNSDSYKNRLSTYIGDKYKSITTNNTLISNNTKHIKDSIGRVDELRDYLKIFEGLENLSKKIYQKVATMPIECVEDLDIIKAKLDSIRQIFRSNRYNFDKMDYFIDSLTSTTNPENALRYLTNHHYVRDYKREILQGIEQANRVLDRF
jgi:hypothetical protein